MDDKRKIKSRGRPKASSLRKLTKSVTVKFSKPDDERLLRKSRQANRTLVEYIRDSAFDAQIVAKHLTEDATTMRNLVGMANNLNQLTKLSHQMGFYRTNEMIMALLHKLKEDHTAIYVHRKEVAMIGKIKKGKTFGGCVRYVMGKDNAEIIASDGVLLGSNRKITDNFNYQRMLNPKIKQPLGHIALNFKLEDKPRLPDEFMAKIAIEYMALMRVENTQFILVRHHNTDNPHCHLVYNHIGYDGKVISSQGNYKRNEIATKRLKDKYGLTYADEKSKTNTEKLRPAERVKYEIHNAVKAVLKRSRTWREFEELLKRQGIGLEFKLNRRTGEKEVLSFTKDGLTFRASDIGRQFSYSKLNTQLGVNKPETEQGFESKKPKREQMESQIQLNKPSGNDFIKGGLGLFTPSESNPQDEQILYDELLHRRRIKKKRKGLGL